MYLVLWLKGVFKGVECSLLESLAASIILLGALNPESSKRHGDDDDYDDNDNDDQSSMRYVRDPVPRAAGESAASGLNPKP